MRRIALLGFAAATLAAIAACTPSNPGGVDTAADRTAIESIAKAHAVAFFSGDIDSIVAGYAEDAIVMPPGAPVAKGRENIRKLFQASMAGAMPGQSEFYEDYTVEVSGDVGWDSGVSRVKDSTGAIIWSGHFLATWRKKDGKWQTIGDMWTNDPPVAH